MKIKVDYALIGRNLDLKHDVCIDIEDTIIKDIASPCSESVDIYIPDSIALPPLCNAHIHVLDSSLMEYGEDKKLHELVSLPQGLKYTLLRTVDRKLLVESVRRVIKQGIEQGVMVFGIYVELGDEGCAIVRDAMPRILLARLLPQPEPEKWNDISRYLELLERYRGLGIDKLTDFDREQLMLLSDAATKYEAHIHSHVSETKELYLKKDYELLKILRPRAFIHGLYIPEDFLREIDIPWIFCPRSNMYFNRDIPNPRLLMAYHTRGISIGLGTDNSAWFSPSILEEASFAYMVARAELNEHERTVWIRTLLYSMTFGCYEILGFKLSGIEIDAPSLFIIVSIPGLRLSHNPILTLIKRGGLGAKFFVIDEDVVPSSMVVDYDRPVGLKIIERLREEL